MATDVFMAGGDGFSVTQLTRAGPFPGKFSGMPALAKVELDRCTHCGYSRVAELARRDTGPAIAK
jgi:hypothetical protein